MSFKQGDHTRDYEWMLELEEVVEQGLDPPNIAHVKQLMMMAKICDVAQVRKNRSGFTLLNLRVIVLPRQARDKQRETTQNSPVFSQDEGDATRDKYRAKALKLAALKLKGHPTLVTTEQQVPATIY